MDFLDTHQFSFCVFYLHYSKRRILLWFRGEKQSVKPNAARLVQCSWTKMKKQDSERRRRGNDVKQDWKQTYWAQVHVRLQLLCEGDYFLFQCGDFLQRGQIRWHVLNPVKAQKQYSVFPFPWWWRWCMCTGLNTSESCTTSWWVTDLSMFLDASWACRIDKTG